MAIRILWGTLARRWLRTSIESAGAIAYASAMKTHVDVAARVVRGTEIEAIHYASIAVVDERGKLTHYLGDPNFVTMTRSCIKPFQLLPLVTSGAADSFGFDQKQLAIMAGSHNGTDEHRQVVLSNLALASSGPGDLQCGSHWPIWMEDRRLYPLQGEDRDSARHNCSGKHSGFLALAKFLKDDIRRYLDPESPTQRAVLSAVSNYCEYPREKMFIGIDGCSAPNFPLALINVARGFSKLATGQGSTREEIRAVGCIKDAMLANPEMVSGEGRFDLALARAFPGRLLCKVGAEAIEAIALDDPPIGIVVKIHDGNWRALWPVCIEVLRQLGYIEEVKPESPLARYVRPEILNARGIVTGQVVPEFELRTV